MDVQLLANGKFETATAPGEDGSELEDSSRGMRGSWGVVDASLAQAVGRDEERRLQAFRPDALGTHLTLYFIDGARAASAGALHRAFSARGRPALTSVAQA